MVSLIRLQLVVLVYQFNYESSGTLVDTGFYFTYGCLVPVVVNANRNVRTRICTNLSLAGHIPHHHHCAHRSQLLASRLGLIPPRRSRRGPFKFEPSEGPPHAQHHQISPAHTLQHIRTQRARHTPVDDSLQRRLPESSDSESTQGSVYVRAGDVDEGGESDPRGAGACSSRSKLDYCCSMTFQE